MSSSLYNTSSLVGSASKAASSAIGAIIWVILSLVIAIAGGILIYVLFLNKKNEGKLTGFPKWLYEVLGFKKMLVEMLLKVSYLILAIYITLSSLAMIISNFFGFLFMLVGGNLMLRIGYEFALMTIIMCRNTTEMNANLKKLVPKEEPVKQDVQ